jgi:hypothetical protein
MPVVPIQSVVVPEMGIKSDKISCFRILNVAVSQGDQYIEESPSFGKRGAETANKPINAKISPSKLNLKVQNIFIKPLLKPKNTFN